MNSYLKAGLKAVREKTPDALAVLHVETPNVSKYETIMQSWERDGVDYDVFGSSCYPFWSVSTRAQSPENLSKVVKLAAKYGKLFCVMETAWPTTLKEADGTNNQIGQNTQADAYELSPQGQVDELTEQFEAVVSEPNGLGSFYWEPAWIPIKAGWINWKYNKATANKYGCGWASEGAALPDREWTEGYFNKNKMYYNGEPTWGGCSWENNALFDTNGYPLKSLAFYKEAVSAGSEQTVTIHLVDKKGKKIAADHFVKVACGETTTVTLPKVDAYKPASGSYSYKITAGEGDFSEITVEYTGPFVEKGKKYAVGGSTYKVTKLATSKKRGTIQLVKSKNSKSVTIPAYVKLIDGRNYNVTSIGSKAFAKTSKVKTVIIKTKKLAKSRVKNCFKSSKVSKVKIKVGKTKANKKYLKKYKKFMTKKVTGRRVKLTK